MSTSRNTWQETARTYHYTKAQAQRRCEKDITFLYGEVSFARDVAYQNVNADDAGSDDTCCAEYIISMNFSTKMWSIYIPMPLTMHMIQPRVSLSTAASILTAAVAWRNRTALSGQVQPLSIMIESCVYCVSRCDQARIVGV